MRGIVHATYARREGRIAALVLLGALAACGGQERQEPAEPTTPVAPAAAPSATPPSGTDRAALRSRARGVFGKLPAEASNPANPVTDAKVALGRTLYYDARLSKNQDIACNSCHLLGSFGVDGQPNSPGHRGQRGDRNSPTVYNAALHVAQFWDGRAADVEEQAKGPVLNPIEMAMPSEAAVVAVLESIPGYAPLFQAAFPEDAQPITYDNMARAIGAFERRLMTPSAFDAFLAGNDAALTDSQVAGAQAFMDTGCISCHMGPAVGGSLYRKLGLVKPYPTEDPGREKVTGDPADLHVFKVPGLRNVAHTGPWLHDGSITSLDRVISIMAEHQLGRSLGADEVSEIRAFLESLTGTLETALIEPPELPPSGPDTPAPDPS
jgi:cytochrome c peroxidase